VSLLPKMREIPHRFWRPASYSVSFRYAREGKSEAGLEVRGLRWNFSSDGSGNDSE
jgi:hypothetical protein